MSRKPGVGAEQYLKQEKAYRELEREAEKHIGGGRRPETLIAFRQAVKRALQVNLSPNQRRWARLTGKAKGRKRLRH